MHLELETVTCGKSQTAVVYNLKRHTDQH